MLYSDLRVGVLHTSITAIPSRSISPSVYLTSLDCQRIVSHIRSIGELRGLTQMMQSKKYRTAVFDLAALENRLLYCVDSGLGVAFGTYPMVMGPSLLMSGSTTSTGTVAGAVGVSGGV